MNDLLERGIDLFNQTAWYDAHEVWEDLWRQTTGEARSFYQGLVQVAVGLHHLSRGNTRGGRRVLGRGLARLKSYPDLYGQIDNLRLQRDLDTALTRSEPCAVHIFPAPVP